MSELNLTAGAARAIAALKAVPQPSPAALFHRLIAFLIENEGNATEILRNAGVVLPVHPAGEEPTVAGEFHFLEWQRQFVHTAEKAALVTNAEGAPGSEHLLLAAVELDSGIASLLSDFGLTRDVLLKLITVPEPELTVSGSDSLTQLQPAGVGNIDQAGLFRILDASANRAREGLRVIEDYIRFRRDDGVISRELKQVRHLLTASLTSLGQHRWVAARDSLQDVGTLGSLASERHRGSLEGVIRANMKRVEEALRSLEEYSKLLDQELSQQISQCRYRMYTIEKSLEALMQGRQRLAGANLYLLVTASQCRYDPEETIRHAIEKGVDIVQIREKEMSDGELIKYAERVRKVTERFGALLIMNDRADLAAAIGADGVHLGQEDMSVQAARKVLGGSGLVGVSTHSLEQARQAIFDGADYLGVGPVFPSNTKTFEDFPGLAYVKLAAENVSIPWFAIGGIQADNIADVLDAGGKRVAVSSTICRAPDPRGVTQMLKARLSAAGPSPDDRSIN